MANEWEGKGATHRSTSLRKGSLSGVMTSSTASQWPFVMSLTKLSMLSTVLRTCRERGVCEFVGIGVCLAACCIRVGECWHDSVLGSEFVGMAVVEQCVVLVLVGVCIRVW
jgi:hypothetical protein